MAHKVKASHLLREAAETYAERNKVYGDNYKLVGAVMKGFFPEGVFLKTEDDHNRFHIFMLAIVKLTRYTVNWYPNVQTGKVGHRDSIRDATVYCAMLEEIDAEIESRNGKDNEATQRANGGAVGGEKIS